MADVLWINGRFTTTDERVLGVEDRGFLFGDAVYEVLKFLRKKPLFVSDHYRRLQSGLTEIEIPVPWSEEEFVTLLSELLSRSSFDDGVVYFEVSRGEEPRAHMWGKDLRPTAIAFSRAFRFPDAEKKRNGISLITARDIRWGLCNVKSVNLLANALGKNMARKAGANEVLFIRDKEVTEGASSTFFAVRDGRIVTHPTGCEILSGTVRDHVISAALDERIRVDERPLREDELFGLDEAFVTSTTQGVMPVTRIDQREVGDGTRGPMTTRLQKLFEEIERREVES
ncbi:MAG: aminotransferase class IV [Thermoanaerobaculia bacterium]